MSAAVRSRAAVGVALVLWAFGVPAAPAAAHGQKPEPGQGHVEPVLDALPDELEALRVQVHESLAPQLAVENTGPEMLEVLDERSEPFLRLGPGGAEANLAAVAWYRTASPSDAVPIPQDVLDAAVAGRTLAPRWRRIAAEPAWGWFDRRIETDERRAPAEVVAADRPAEVGRWDVPVRLGGRASALRGRFVYRPKATGSVRLELRGERELAPGARVSLLAGRGGSLFLRSRSERTVTVLGEHGEPFLRFTPAGVEANLHSATFDAALRLRGGSSLAREPRAADAAPRWKRLSPAPRYGWIDPRAAGDPEQISEAARAGVRAEIRRWAVPVRVGSGDDAALVRVEGATVWQPFPPGAADGQGRKDGADRAG